MNKTNKFFNIINLTQSHREYIVVFENQLVKAMCSMMLYVRLIQKTYLLEYSVF